MTNRHFYSSKPLWYRLIGKLAVPCTVKQAARSADLGRSVKQTEIGPLFVSTVFISMDHNIFGSEPHLFETMIFEDEIAEYQIRTSTWGEAEKAHEKAVTVAEARLARAKEAVKLGGSDAV
jgi:hypothetical protein